MIFYKITAKTRHIDIPENDSENKTWTRQSRPVYYAFNRQFQGKAAFCISEIFPDQAILAAVIDAEYQLTHSAAELAVDFLGRYGIEADRIAAEEIDYGCLCDLLDSAEKSRFILDKAHFLNVCNIDLNYNRSRRFMEDRVVTQRITAQELRGLAKKNYCETTLCPEIERIQTPPTAATHFYKHPVHYMLRFDLMESVQPVVEGMLFLLYQNKRLISARYLDFTAPILFGDSGIDNLRAMYETLGGGAAMLNFSGFYAKDDEYVTPSESTVAKACELALEFRKTVLTIFCLHKTDEKTKTMIYGCMGDTPVVEISTAAVDCETARKHLAARAKESGMQPDKALYAPFTDRKAFYDGNDLNNVFDAWYHRTMKTKIFPQYAAISASRAVAAKAPPKGSAYEELYRMIGLDEAKKVITDALNYFKIQKLCNNRGVIQERPAMHMAFTGNPGTAKTTAARLFARIMKENHLLSVGDVVEVGRADLIGKYVGWTAKIVKEKFRAAQGGVLFIDEAYSLVDDRNGLYGDEAINTIVQEMENQREDLVVIFAGYPGKMEEFLKKNPGLRSRIAFHVPFPDYSPRELSAILELMCEKQKVRLGEGAGEHLSRIFQQAKNQPDFGNGRFVRNLLEAAKMRQASRLAKTDCDRLTDDDLFTLAAEDFEYAPPTPDCPQKKIVGFCG